MINRELLKQAQAKRNEEQRLEREKQEAKRREQEHNRFLEVQLLLARLGVEVSTDDMTINLNNDDFAVLVMVGDVLTGYPLRVWYYGSAWWIQVGDIRDFFNSGLSGGSVSDLSLWFYRAQLGDMLDKYDAGRTEAIKDFKTEIAPTLPAQDESIDDLAAQVDEAFYELRAYAEVAKLRHLIGNAQQAWREFSKRALAAPARHPDFDKWYQALEDGKEVQIGATSVFINGVREAIIETPHSLFYSIAGAKQAIADLQNAIALAEQWNKDAEAANDIIGWNDHLEL